MDDFCLHETTKAQLWPVLKDLYCPPKPISVMGETRYVKSTKLLDTGDMTRYLEQIDMWAHQRGLRLTIPPRCEYRQLMETQNA